MQIGKTIFSFLFLVLILAISLRFLLLFSYIKTQKKEFRKTVIESGSNQTRILKIHKSALYRDLPGCEWKEHNKELVLNGKYHEVLRIRSEGEFVQVCLLEDTKETRLFAQFLNNSEQDDDFLKVVSNLLSLQFTVALNEINFTYDHKIVKQSFVWQEGLLSDFSKAPLRPPQG